MKAAAAVQDDAVNLSDVTGFLHPLLFDGDTDADFRGS